MNAVTTLEPPRPDATGTTMEELARYGEVMVCGGGRIGWWAQLTSPGGLGAEVKFRSDFHHGSPASAVLQLGVFVRMSRKG